MTIIMIRFQHVMLDDEMETSIAERYAMDQVAIVTELKRTGTDHVIVVANTHICFGNFMKPDLQILQAIHVSAKTKINLQNEHIGCASTVHLRLIVAQSVTFITKRNGYGVLL